MRKKKLNYLNISEFFKIFADETRLKILDVLCEKEHNVTEICTKVKMNKSAVSHQLRILKNSRLVRFYRKGKNIYFAIDDDHINQILQISKEHISEV